MILSLSLVVLILWLIFFLYWAVSAVGVKRNVAGKGSWAGGFLGRVLFVVVVLFVLNLSPIAGVWDRVNSLPIFNSEAAGIVGVVLTAIGIAFAIWARRNLGSNWSGRPTMKVGHELVTSGPYRFVRHPIYTGMLTALFGSALVAGPIWFISFIVFFAVFIWRIGVEERYMMELFPDQYPAYRARTKALIPFVW